MKFVSNEERKYHEKQTSVDPKTSLSKGKLIDPPPPLDRNTINHHYY